MTEQLKARPAGWNSIPKTPPVEMLDFYGDQFSEPVLLHDGSRIMHAVARWSFVDDGWVGAQFSEGASPSDYEWLNDSPKYWMLLSRVTPTPLADAAGIAERAVYVFLVPGDVIQATDERYSAEYCKWKPIAPLYVGTTVEASTRPVRRAIPARAALATTEAPDAIAPTEDDRIVRNSMMRFHLLSLICAWESGMPLGDRFNAALQWMQDNSIGTVRLMSNAAPSPEAPAVDAPKACPRCGGSGFVPDGEITGSGGVEFENGPVQCVKDCPECTAHPASEPKGLTLTDAQRAAVKYGISVMRSVSWETTDKRNAINTLDSLLLADSGSEGKS